MNLADLGRAVKEARKELALTQAEAAALCGVSMPFLNQLEGAKRAHLSITKVLCVSSGLGVKLFAGGATARPGTGMLSIQGLAPSVVIRNHEGQVIDPATGTPRKASGADESNG